MHQLHRKSNTYLLLKVSKIYKMCEKGIIYRIREKGIMYRMYEEGIMYRMRKMRIWPPNAGKIFPNVPSLLISPL